MVNVTPLIKKDAQVIQSYAGGGFKVSGQAYDEAVIVTAENTQKWNTSEARAVQDFQPLIDMKDELDVVLLGTGAKIHFLPPDLKQALKEQGLNVEVMDTGAACRTYNVLMAEGRRVAAALVPVFNKGTE